MFRFVQAAIAVAFLSGPAWAQEKVLDRTQADWVKILEDKDKEKRFRRAAVLALKRCPETRTKETMTALTPRPGQGHRARSAPDIAVLLGGLGDEAKGSVEALKEHELNQVE